MGGTFPAAAGISRSRARVPTLPVPSHRSGVSRAAPARPSAAASLSSTPAPHSLPAMPSAWRSRPARPCTTCGEAPAGTGVLKRGTREKNGFCEPPSTSEPESDEDPSLLPRSDMPFSSRSAVARSTPFFLSFFSATRLSSSSSSLSGAYFFPAPSAKASSSVMAWAMPYSRLFTPCAIRLFARATRFNTASARRLLRGFRNTAAGARCDW
mmetsp:Transcript_17575/g.60068  ORF Transcript_17575/g.60068 Transcript_17575/m.60068 type:complete len:211 (+) Transcript_17575:367-999(+)